MAIWDRLLWGRADAAAPSPGPMLPAPAGLGYASKFAAVLERIDSIANGFTGLGGALDKGAAGRPDTARPCLTLAELTALYRFNGYVRRFVDIVPDYGTRNGFTLQGAPADGEKATAEDADLLGDEFDRLDAGNAFAEAWSWARLYGGAVIFPVLDESVPPEFADRPGEWLQQPLRPELINRVVALVVLDRLEATPFDYDGDIRSANFRRPLTWSLTPLGVSAGAFSAVRVHHSRVIYLPGAPLPPSQRYANGGYDDSVIESTWDQLRNKTTIDQSLAVLAQEIKTNVVKIEGLKGLKAGDQAAAFDVRMGKFAQGLGLLNMVLLAEGETFEQRHAQLAGVKDLDGSSQASVQGVTGLPGTVLFGGSPAGLSTDDASARTNLEKMISAKQERKLAPGLEQLARLLFAQRDHAATEPDNWRIVFAPLGEPTIKERVEAEKMQAEADQIRIQSGVMDAEHVARSRFGGPEYSWDLQPLADDEIDEVPDDRAGLLESAEIMPAEPLADLAVRGDTIEQAYPGQNGPVKLAVLVMLSETARAGWSLARAESRRVFGEPLRDEATAPHVTALYLGEIDAVHAPEAIGLIGAITTTARPFVMHGQGLALFEPQRHADQAWPVLVDFDGGHGGPYELRDLHTELLRALAHLVTARQFAEFKPHSTLGRLEREPTAGERAALLESPAGRFAVAVSEVVLMSSGRPLARFPLGGAPAVPDAG